MSQLKRSIFMRALACSLGLLGLSMTAAAAQVPYGSVVTDPGYQAQQQIDRQRAIALENQLNTLDARVQSEQRLRDFQATVPAPGLRGPDHPAPTTGAPYASIPDAALAASNERVRAASKNPR